MIPTQDEDEVRAVARVLEEQAAVLDRLAVRHVRAHRSDWRALLETAYALKKLARRLPVPSLFDDRLAAVLEGPPGSVAQDPREASTSTSERS